MFTVKERPDAIETLELRDEDAKSILVLAPARGGIATRLALGGKHAFFLDESTLRDSTKNVRGGNPVLFPQPGKLEGDAYVHGGRTYAMKQHGFARTLPWTVETTRTSDSAEATLVLASNDTTRASYPWDFRAEYTYSLRGKKLRITQRFTNESTSDAHGPMPFGAGFHPYFHVRQAHKRGMVLGTKATRAFDNLSKRTGPMEAFDLTRDEVDLHLEDHGDGPFTMTWGEQALVLRASPEMSRWVVWTLKGKDFVCVEPWTCAGNALRTGQGLIELAKGETRELWFEIESTTK